MTGRQYGTERSLAPNLPQNAPWVAPSALVDEDATFVQQLAPMGLRLPAPPEPTEFVVSPVNHGLLYVSGVRSLNGPGEVEVVRFVSGNGADIARNAAPFDAAAYRSSYCFCPVDWGCADTFVVTLRGLVPGAALNWVLFGTLQQSWNSCYPSSETVEHHLAAVWGMGRGLDPCDRGILAAWQTEIETSRNSRAGSPTTRPLATSRGGTRRSAPRRKSSRTASSVWSQSRANGR